MAEESKVAVIVDNGSGGCNEKLREGGQQWETEEFDARSQLLVSELMYRTRKGKKKWYSGFGQRPCDHPGCNKRPSFGNPDDQQARYCCNHKRSEDVDVVNKWCEHPGCKIRPSFGNPDDHLARYCRKHKRDDDVDVVSKRCQQ